MARTVTRRTVPSSSDEEIREVRTGTAHTQTPNGNGAQHNDDEEEEQDENGGEDSPARRRKRLKVEKQRPSVPASAPRSQMATQSSRVASQAAQSASEADDGDTVLEQTRTFFEERDSNGYVPGSVLRVACQNFLTYDALEFSPGPRLNMVIGPNGTGKSTIVCALALGLGNTPRLLGRADEIKQFVKHGKDNAWVEVELKGRQSKPNVCIRRTFSKENNSSKFTMNGSSTTQEKVENAVRALNVQCKNLCSFLPQDKVAHFAKMTPIDLLHWTQRAAGHPKLEEWHTSLVNSEKVKSELEDKLKSKRRELDALQDKLNSMQRQVERYRARRKIEEQILVLELGLTFASYDAMRVEFERLKVDFETAKQDVQRREAQTKPVHEHRQLFEMLDERISDTKKSLISSADDHVAQGQTDFRKAGEQDTEAIKEKLADLKDKEKQRKKDIQKLKAEIEKYQKTVNTPVPEPDMGPLREAQQEAMARLRQIQRDIEGLDGERQSVVADQKDNEAKYNRMQREIKQLLDVEVQRMEQLNRNPHTRPLYEAAKRVQVMKKEKRFKGPVFGPLSLCISPKHADYAATVEYSLTSATLSTFLCTTTEDYNLVMDDVVGKGNLRLTVAVLPPHATLESMIKPVDEATLKGLGFQSFVLDLVEGPEYVLAYLCVTHSIHQIPVAAADAPVDERIFHDRRHPVKRWIVGNVTSSISFSKYGNKEMTIKSFKMGQARTLKNFTANKTEIEKLQARQRDCSDEKAELERKLDETSARVDECAIIRTEREDELSGIKQQMVDILAPRKIYKTALTTLEHKQAILTKKQKEPSTEAQEAGLIEKLRQAAAKRLECLIRYKSSIEQRKEIDVGMTKLRMQELKIRSEKIRFEELTNGNDDELESAKAILHTVKAQKETAKVKAKEVFNQAMSAHEAAQPSVREELEILRAQETTVEQLEIQLNTKRTELDMNEDVDEQTIRRFEDNTKKLEEIQAVVEAHERTLDGIDSELKQTLDRYEPEINRLIVSIDKKYDATFKRMDRMGAIGLLAPKGEFSKWGIEIKVSFRKESPLHVLDAFRQSGGERSLSTIVYHMSLTELTRSPFTLVDEINQGMDQQAERMMHDQLVEIHCQETSAQTWLITPKLLPQLRYHTNMKILCIFNGEWIPHQFDAKGWIQKNRNRTQ